MGDSEDSDDLANMLDDIDDLDNDLFGKNLKKTGAKGTAKTAKLAQTNKKVSFAEKSKTPSYVKKGSSGSENEDLGFEPSSKKMGKSSLDDLFGPTTTKKPPDKTSKANKADIFDLFTSDKPKAKASLDSDPEPTAKKRQGIGLDDLFGPTTRSATDKLKKPVSLDHIFGGSGGSGSDTDDRRASAKQFGSDTETPKPSGRKVPRGKADDFDWLNDMGADKKSTRPPVSTDSDEEVDKTTQKRGKPVKKTSDGEEKPEKTPIGFDPLALVKPKIEVKSDQGTNSRTLDLEKQIDKLQSEKAELDSQLELLKQQHQIELEKYSEKSKSDLNLIESQFKANEKRLTEENQQLTKELQNTKSQAFDEIKKIEEMWRERLAQTSRIHEEQTDQLKSLNKKALDTLKEDNDETIKRLRKSMNSQMEAASSAYEYTKNYTEIVNSIQLATTELKDLTSKMTQLHDVGVQTRQNSLKIGEERVTYLQQRLEQELGDLNFEKEKIHSLMSKLESLTREQQATLDKDRWELKQEQNKLSAYQSAFTEEKRHIVDRIEVEKSELQKAKENFLNEQQNLLIKILAEHEKLAREKAEFLVRRDADITRLKQEALLLEERNRQFEGMAKSASKTQSEVELKRQEILRLEQELILEKANLERERSQIEFEKSSIYESKLRDSSMILDPETISLEVITKKETEDLMRRHKVELDRKLQQIKAEKDSLFDKEQKLLKLFAQLAEERKDLTRLREASICPFCYKTVSNTEFPGREAAERPYESPPISRLSRSNSIRRP